MQRSIPRLKGSIPVSRVVPKVKTQKKVKTTVSLDPDILSWARANAGPGKRFYNLTHAVELGLQTLREKK